MLQGSARAGAARDLAELTGLDEVACAARHPARRCSQALPAHRWPAPLPGRSPSGCTSSSVAATRCMPRWSRGRALPHGVGQQFVPGGKDRRALLPLSFCRECGQEYYSVWRRDTDADGAPRPAAYSQRRLGQLSMKSPASPASSSSAPPGVARRPRRGTRQAPRRLAGGQGGSSRRTASIGCRACSACCLTALRATSAWSVTACRRRSASACSAASRTRSRSDRTSASSRRSAPRAAAPRRRCSAWRPCAACGGRRPQPEPPASS